VLMAATTENPSFSVVAPLLSRSLLLALRPLTDDAVRDLVLRAVADERGLDGAVQMGAQALEHLVRTAAGDARRALTALEAAAGAALEEAAGAAPREPAGAAPGEAAGQAPRVELRHAERALDRAAVRYDRDGDQHYDVASALIKSMRGSDVDAAVHYLARMLEAGEDPRFVARRLVVAASEDVGMADPTALQVAVAAAQAVQLVGMPEGRIVLTQAVVHLALAPKSNAVIRAVDAAVADIRAGRGSGVPAHLRDAHYAGSQRHGHGVGYRYPHDAPHGVLAQQYAPDDLVGRSYYQPSDRGLERDLAGRLDRLRQVVRGGRTDGRPDGTSPGGTSPGGT
jgi:putative ATPase